MLLLLALSACSGDPGPADTDPNPRDTGTPDTDPVETNAAPTAAAISLSPAAPAPGVDLTVVVVTPATDPDGDAVSYRFAWTVDGAPTQIAGEVVPGASTVADQRWEVTVTPTDGRLDGPPAVAGVVIQNTAPSAPGLAFDPVEPVIGEDIRLVIDPDPVDPDGDPVTTSITWYNGASLLTFLADQRVIEGRYVKYGDVYRAVVSVTDGFHDPVVTEATVSVDYSCASLPEFNLGDATLVEARAYHGIAFTDDGALLGYDGRDSLVKSFYDGSRQLFLPGVGTIQQIERLPDGDFVAADSSGARLLRITPDGGMDTIATNFATMYGVTVGPDGMVYVVDGGIHRVDPVTGEKTTLMESGRGWTAHTMNFNLDSTVMYIGTIGSGDVYFMDLDEDLNPTTEPRIYASRVGGGWHDGLVVDVCGNLYVADYSNRGLYRVNVDKSVTSLVTTDANSYGHGVTWGNGVGGWRTDAVYQPQPYNNYTVREVVIGMANGDTVRTWKGAPAPW